jgi:uncharacterized membrane protein YjjB (DUF3815 family)
VMSQTSATVGLIFGIAAIIFALVPGGEFYPGMIVT